MGIITTLVLILGGGPGAPADTGILEVVRRIAPGSPASLGISEVVQQILPGTPVDLGVSEVIQLIRAGQPGSTTLSENVVRLLLPGLTKGMSHAEVVDWLGLKGRVAEGVFGSTMSHHVMYSVGQTQQLILTFSRGQKYWADWEFWGAELRVRKIEQSAPTGK